MSDLSAPEGVSAWIFYPLMAVIIAAVIFACAHFLAYMMRQSRTPRAVLTALFKTLLLSTGAVAAYTALLWGSTWLINLTESHPLAIVLALVLLVLLVPLCAVISVGLLSAAGVIAYPLGYLLCAWMFPPEKGYAVDAAT